ncbi:MAG TPA: nuclear transport factor 2 family protein [Mycobacterium sp.]|nr:nuclear transport factor 2 family protein [Mycobacterium sp.]
MSEQNVDIVQKGYEAFSAGDVETLMSLFDDNIEWVQPGESTLSGIYRGKAEFGEYLRQLAEKAVAVRTLRFMSDGETVVAFTEVTVGSEMGEDADVYTVRNGKIVHAQIYTDTAMIERVFGRREVAAG